MEAVLSLVNLWFTQMMAEIGNYLEKVSQHNILTSSGVEMASQQNNNTLKLVRIELACFNSHTSLYSCTTPTIHLMFVSGTFMQQNRRGLKAHLSHSDTAIMTIIFKLDQTSYKI